MNNLKNTNWKTPFGTLRLTEHFLDRSLGNGVCKMGSAIDGRIDDAAIDTEISYRLFSLILCSGESVEAEFSRWFWMHLSSRY